MARKRLRMCLRWASLCRDGGYAVHRSLGNVASFTLPARELSEQFVREGMGFDGLFYSDAGDPRSRT